MSDDFVVGVKLVIQDTNGVDIFQGGAELLSDETLQMVMDDVAEFLKDDDNA